MDAISKVQGTTDPRLTDQVAKSTASELTTNSATRQLEASLSAKASKGAVPEEKKSARENAPNIMDPVRLRSLVKDLQEAIDEASAEPHDVGFRQDPGTETFVIEIRTPDGELIKQFPPEFVLNLKQKLDELSGMVVDELS